MNVAWDACVGGCVAGWLAGYEIGRLRLLGRGQTCPGWRRIAWWAAAVLFLAVALPPLATEAARSEWAETLQFALLAFGAAPLAVLAAPCPPLAALLGVRAPRAALTRRTHAWAALVAFVAVTVAWRVPAAVDALAAGRGWLPVEAVTLLVGTAGLWSSLHGCPPWPAAGAPPRRIALSALAVWSAWVFAYAIGFSPHPFYPAYAGGPTPVGAQQWTVAIIWAASAAALVPVAFVNLARWLKTEQFLAEAETPRRLRRPSEAAVLRAGGEGSRAAR